MEDFIIAGIKARQILDSRGNPTVEADVWLKNGAFGRVAVPSGASTGVLEAVELRDGDQKRFAGRGVLKAVWQINSTICDVLVGNSSEQNIVDQLMIDLDGRKDKSRLGANAILAVSLAVAKAVARAKKIPFYAYVAELAGTTDEMSLPMPMMNVMNGGAHANFVTDIQEYMVIPKGAGNIYDAVRMGAEIFHTLGQVLKERGYLTLVGDEGGYAPNMQKGNEEPLVCIKLAVERAGYGLGRDVVVALDVAASELLENQNYVLKSVQKTMKAEELIDWYKQIIPKYHIVSIEDGLAENDWNNWQKLTDELGKMVQLVGDDLFVTNEELLIKGIERGVANAILVKPNQIGTLTETIKAVLKAKKAGYRTIVSHRSGETEDITIAHLAVGLGVGQIKTGSLSRSDRIAKYNELLRIAESNSRLGIKNLF